MTVQQILIDGGWRDSASTNTFQVDNPALRERLPDVYPVSDWADCDAALDAASRAFEVMRTMPADQLAQFLERYADRIEARQDELVAMAHAETALPVSPRLADGELPRTTGQLRAAAVAAREGTWAMATIDTAANIRSQLAPLGPVCVFGPNNFPFAFGSISGGDFATAIATGNPVIAKANSSHPGTTRIFAEEAQQAAGETGMPAGAVQLLYRTRHADGERLVSDTRTGATGYTGSRSAGLVLKQAADAAGKPIYLELSSVNPVIVLPGALEERADAVADEFTGSCLMGTGQFCTNPGVVVLIQGGATEKLIETLVARFEAAPVGTLLSAGVAHALAAAVDTLQVAGARLLTGGAPVENAAGFSYANTLLRVEAAKFIDQPEQLQTEAFGNVSLLVVADDVAQAGAAIDCLEGNLTGCIYSHTADADDAAYRQLEPRLRQKVGRLLNDKMPTGVAVSSAMNHGGPFPATGHPGFTAVGVPAAMHRFAALHCYDAVRQDRLPPLLQDKNPAGCAWRLIDGAWTQADVG